MLAVSTDTPWIRPCHLLTLFIGTLYFAYLKASDKLELTVNGKEARLECSIVIGIQSPAIVSSYQQLIPAASDLDIPDVDVQYPPYEVINNTKVAKDPIVCTSSEICKIIVIFSGR